MVVTFNRLPLLQALLARDEYNLVLAKSGAEALTQVLRREFAVILLDVAMPGLTGFDVCRLVKSNPFTSRIPVLMLTGLDDDAGKRVATHRRQHAPATPTTGGSPAARRSPARDSEKRAHAELDAAARQRRQVLQERGVLADLRIVDLEDHVAGRQPQLLLEVMLRSGVILAGGIGSRFWPASTPSRPKQLLTLGSDRPLIRDTIERVRRREPMRLAAEMLRAQLPPLSFSTGHLMISGILEPCYDVGGDAFDYAVNGEIAHLALFDAARMHYFDAAAPEFEVAVAQIRLVFRHDFGRLPAQFLLLFASCFQK